MEAIKCIDAYQEGIADRLAKPLHAGMYKLIETRRGWFNTLSELRRIRRYLIGEELACSLLHCTSDDYHKYVRDALLWTAYDASNKILPAVAALAADGVLTSTIKCAERYLKTNWPNVHEALEFAHVRLKKDRDVEADLVNLQKSRAYRALREADTWLRIGLIDLPTDRRLMVFPDLKDESEHDA